MKGRKGGRQILISLVVLIAVFAGGVGLWHLAEMTTFFGNEETGLLDLVYIIPYLFVCWWVLLKKEGLSKLM